MNAGTTNDRRGHLYLFDTGAIFTSAQFKGLCTASYHAAIIVTRDRGTVQPHVEGFADRYEAMAIRPGTRHTVVCEQGMFIGVRLNPLHPQFRRFSAIAPTGVVALDREIFSPFDASLEAAYRGELTVEQGLSLFAGLTTAAVGRLPCGKPVDPRIDRVLRFLDLYPGCMLSVLSTSFGMSNSRMSHVFRDSVGLPLQTYLRWQRVHCAIQRMQSGQTFTELAQAEGYTDLAHFVRELRESTGMLPSYVFQSGHINVFRWYQNHLLPHASRQNYPRQQEERIAFVC